jgi:hypothetical protein
MISKIIKAEIWKSGKKMNTNGITLTLKDTDKTERRLFISSIVLNEILERHTEKDKNVSFYSTTGKLFEMILETKTGNQKFN